MDAIDLRGDTRPLESLLRIIEEENPIIWGEVDSRPGITCLDRFSLQPSSAMVIWTIPPGLNELRSTLQKVKPRKVFLFGINPGMDESETFLKRLLGLIKYRLKSAHGIASLSSLAAATAQRTSTIKIGLGWLEAHDHISIRSIKEDEIQVDISRKTSKKDSQAISDQLNFALTESAAFRRYFLKADKERLVQYE